MNYNKFLYMIHIIHVEFFNIYIYENMNVVFIFHYNKYIFINMNNIYIYI